MKIEIGKTFGVRFGDEYIDVIVEFIRQVAGSTEIGWYSAHIKHTESPDEFTNRITKGEQLKNATYSTSLEI